MNNIFFTILTLLFLFTMKAQTPIKPLYMKGGNNVSGAYYKDLNNDFDNFTGTWQLVNGSTTLKIVFEKREQIYIEDYDAYYDVLVGEYKYLVNGLEKVNTLPNLVSPPTDVYAHNIVGASIIKSTSAPVCNDCTVNERRVSLNFNDPTRPGIQHGLSGKIIVKRADVGASQKIKINLRQSGAYIPPTGTTPTSEQYSFNIPWGEYILTKVN